MPVEGVCAPCQDCNQNASKLKNAPKKNAQVAGLELSTRCYYRPAPEKTPAKQTLAVVSAFKNEGAYDTLCEWIRHHLSQGVSHFYLVDNNSTDGWRASLRGLPAFLQLRKVTILYEPTIGAQLDNLNMWLPIVSASHEWAMVIDVDEYVYATDPRQTISSVLAALPGNVTQVTIFGKLFGSNDEYSQPASVVRGFTRRANFRAKELSFKSIVRTRCICKFGVHYSYITMPGKRPCGITSAPVYADEAARNFSKSWHRARRDSVTGEHAFDVRYPRETTEASLATSPLAMNHYRSMSLEFFLKVKATRGWVHVQDSRKATRKDYFDTYNRTQVLDEQLARLSRAAASSSHPHGVCSRVDF